MKAFNKHKKRDQVLKVSVQSILQSKITFSSSSYPSFFNVYVATFHNNNNKLCIYK